MKGQVGRYVVLLLAIFSFAVGNVLFAVPNTIMNGGMTGLSQMAFYVFGLNIGIGIFLTNLPLFILAFLFYRELFYKSAFGIVCVSVMIGLIQDPLLPYGVHNIWIGSVFGGLWMGMSLGAISKMNASLGGGSLLGRMLHLRYGFSLSRSIFWVDASVYPLSYFVIGGRETFFSLILSATSALGVYLMVTCIERAEKWRERQKAIPDSRCAKTEGAWTRGG